MTDPVSPAVQSPDLALGAAEAAYRAGVDQARYGEWARRLFDRDVTLWSTDAEVGRTIAERLGWLDAPSRFIGPDRRRSKASATGSSRRVSRPPSSPGWAAAASPPTCCIGRSVRARAISTCASSIRPIPAAVAAVLDDLDPLRTLVIVASKSGTTTEPNAFLADALGTASRQRSTHVKHHVYDSPGACVRRDHRPGQERRGDRPPRRLPRGLPQSARHRRALQRADLRRPGAGVAHRDRPRRPARRRPSRCSAACREPDPAANPGVSLGLAIGHAWPAPAATS